MFLRFLTLAGPAHGLTAHPFTICSLPDSDKLIGKPNSVMTFYVKPRGGFTARLAAAASAGKKSSVPVLIEGAYGGLHGRPLTEYDRALVMACGSGAGFSLPFVMEWMRSAAAAAATPAVFSIPQGPEEKQRPAAAPKKMTVVLATRDASLLDWYEATLSDFVETQKLDVPAGAVEILVHLTSDAAVPAKDRSSMSSEDKIAPCDGSKDAAEIDVSVLSGRPDLAAVVRRVTMGERGSVGMAVCGPAAVLEAVRAEAAEAEARIMKGAEGAREVYLYSEVFGW